MTRLGFAIDSSTLFGPSSRLWKGEAPRPAREWIWPTRSEGTGLLLLATPPLAAAEGA